MVFYWFLNFFFLYLWLGTGSGVVTIFGGCMFSFLDLLLGFGAYLSTLPSIDDANEKRDSELMLALSCH